MKLRAYLLMLFVVAVWGSTFVVVKGALGDATPAAFNLVRMLLAFAVLAVAYHRYWRGIPAVASGGGGAGGALPGDGLPVPDHGTGADHAFEIGVHYGGAGGDGAAA